MEAYKAGDLKYGEVDYGTADAFHLPHQCDEWVIGGTAELELFIKEAQSLLIWRKRIENGSTNA